MGSSSWSDDADQHIKKSYVGKATNTVFKNNTTKTIAKEMDPKGVKFREARDSDAHPNSYGVMVFLDVTGSMGQIPEVIVREKMAALMGTLQKHGLNDISVFFGAIGDHKADNYPLQIGQFESGAKELHKWLTETYLEGGGGGGGRESYTLGWLFGGRHTSIDCFEKRGQKGILFTIGDERPWEKIDADYLKQIMGYTEAQDMTDSDILAEAQRLYHVFHIHANQGSYKDDDTILDPWRRLLKENLIIMEDYNELAEIIASTVGLVHGVDLATITKDFDPKTALHVSTALAKVAPGTLAKSEPGMIKL